MSITLVTTWSVETCCYSECRIQWAMSSRAVSDLKDSHGWFYCPNGHRQHYAGKTDAEIARGERDNAQRDVTRLRARLDQQKSETRYQRRSAASLRGHLTRIKRRIAAGVCPCCRRPFSQVMRHMRGQHPEFVSRWGEESLRD